MTSSTPGRRVTSASSWAALLAASAPTTSLALGLAQLAAQENYALLLENPSPEVTGSPTSELDAELDAWRSLLTEPPRGAADLAWLRTSPTQAEPLLRQALSDPSLPQTTLALAARRVDPRLLLDVIAERTDALEVYSRVAGSVASFLVRAQDVELTRQVLLRAPDAVLGRVAVDVFAGKLPLSVPELFAFCGGNAEVLLEAWQEQKSPLTSEIVDAWISLDAGTDVGTYYLPTAPAPSFLLEKLLRVRSPEAVRFVVQSLCDYPVAPSTSLQRLLASRVTSLQAARLLSSEELVALVDDEHVELLVSVVLTNPLRQASLAQAIVQAVGCRVSASARQALLRSCAQSWLSSWLQGLTPLPVSVDDMEAVLVPSPDVVAPPGIRPVVKALLERTSFWHAQAGALPDAVLEVLCSQLHGCLDENILIVRADVRHHVGMRMHEYLGDDPSAWEAALRLAQSSKELSLQGWLECAKAMLEP